MDSELSMSPKDPEQPPRRPRRNRLSSRILDAVWRSPGLLQKDLFRLIGEKDILVLSVLDELIREGLIVRRDEPARIFPARGTPVTATGEPAVKVAAATIASNPANADVALALIKLYQMLTQKIRLEVRFDDCLRASRDGRPILLAEVFPAGLIVRLEDPVEKPKTLFHGIPLAAVDGVVVLGPLGVSHFPALEKGLIRLFG